MVKRLIIDLFNVNKNTNTETIQLTNQDKEQIPIKVTLTPIITQKYVHSGQYRADEQVGDNRNDAQYFCDV